MSNETGTFVRHRLASASIFIELRRSWPARLAATMTTSHCANDDKADQPDGTGRQPLPPVAGPDIWPLQLEVGLSIRAASRWLLRHGHPLSPLADVSCAETERG
jgi:hypothetical protein